MAKQTFTTGQVLTAAQMTALQLNDYNQTVNAKVASYTLVASDAGTRITMSNASATTITLNTSLFAAGDTLFISNTGAGACTITAGTATVSTASSLVLAQYDSGSLYFTSTGVAIWQKYQGASAGGGGKVLQVVFASTSTEVSNASATYADSGLTATITPTLNTSKVLVLVSQNGCRGASAEYGGFKLLRGATQLALMDTYLSYIPSNTVQVSISANYLDSPATTSATTYKTTFSNTSGSNSYKVQTGSLATSFITLLEIGA